MAVLSVKELVDERSSHEDDTVRIYSRHYIVECSLVTDTPYVARVAAGIPRKGDSHPDEAYARCRTIDANPYESLPHVYRVDVVYTTPILGLPNSDNPNPLLRPPEISGSSSLVNRPMLRGDYLGYRRYKKNGTTDQALVLPTDPAFKNIPITNSCYMQFTNVPEEQESVPYITIIRNELPDLTAIMTKKALYENKVNLDPFGVFAAPGYAKMGVISFSQQFENDIRFYRVEYTVSFDPNGWIVEILDVGRLEFLNEIANDYQRIEIKDSAGQPTAVDLNLDGNGRALRDPIPPAVPAGTDIEAVMLLYQRARVNGAINFAPLALLG